VKPDETLELLTAAMLLEQAAIVNQLSRLFTAGAAGALLVLPAAGITIPRLTLSCAAVALAAGVAEAYLAVRVGFDAAVFRQYAEHDDCDFTRIDVALQTLRLRPNGDFGRSVASRFAGSKRLLSLQVLMCLVQMASAVIGAVGAN